MLVFALPVMFVFAVLGIVVGAAVGRKLWDWTAAACLATILGLAPLMTGYFLFRVRPDLTKTIVNHAGWISAEKIKFRDDF